jgi:hypothetical protein
MWKFLASALLGAGLVTLTIPPASAADGHCNYRQFSPKLRSWYRVCQMPATPQTCKELVSAQKEQLEYGEGECPAKGAIDLCVIGTSKLFFYQGKAEDVATGCEMMQGKSRPDLMPKT